MPIIPGILASARRASTNFDSIATFTVGAGGSSAITFSSISSSYKHLQLRCFARSGSASNAGFYIGYNGTLFASGNTSYVSHRLRGDGATATAANTPATNYLLFGSTATNTGSAGGVAIIDILEYANTNINKTTRCLSGNDTNGAGSVILNSGLWMSTAAINQIDIQVDGNFAQYSHIALYGIKA